MNENNIPKQITDAVDKLIAKVSDNPATPVIKVAVVVFPDGHICYVEEGSDYQEVLNGWRESRTSEELKIFEDTRILGGIVKITMLKEVFERLDRRYINVDSL